MKEAHRRYQECTGTGSFIVTKDSSPYVLESNISRGGIVPDVPLWPRNELFSHPDFYRQEQTSSASESWWSQLSSRILSVS